MLSRLYKMLWTRWGGRPWTYIIRDESVAEPLFLYMLCVGLGVLVKAATGRHWWEWLIGVFAGELLGHLFWR